MKFDKAILFYLSICFYSQSFSQSLQLDSNTRNGKLENGLTYYVMSNPQHGGKVDFCLAQKTGSIQEEENQLGLAHFIEHMAFRRTEHISSVTDFLKKNGFNNENFHAETYFDETIYKIMNVSAERIDLIDSSLLLLYDWSCGIALNADEVDKERGVIREERRTTGDAWNRISKQIIKGALEGSRYPDRLPIGDGDIIDNVTYSELRNYYKKWYRPDLQAIIIVGGFDIDSMENKVISLFSKIPIPQNPSKRIYYPIPDNEKPIIVLATDKEAQNSALFCHYKRDVVSDEKRDSEEEFSQYLLDRIIIPMLGDRYAEISNRKDSPIQISTITNSSFLDTRTKNALSISMFFRESKSKEGLNILLQEIERIRQHGFTEEELEKNKTMVLEYFNSITNQNINNMSYLDIYLDHYIKNSPAPSFAFQNDFAKKFIPNINLEQIQKRFNYLTPHHNLIVCIAGPAREDLKYPSEEEFESIISEAFTNPLENTYTDNIKKPLLYKTPTSGKLKKIDKDGKFETTVWTLSNGMKVILKHTSIRDVIQMKAVGKGGKSIFPDTEYINLEFINSKTMGLGDHKSWEISKLLNRNLSFSCNIENNATTLEGSSSVGNFETLLQLIYLQFTEPLKDEESFNMFLQSSYEEIKAHSSAPEYLLKDSSTKALYGDNLRFKRVRLEDLEKVDYSKIFEFYKKCFSNPEDFTLVFIGDINMETIESPILQYLASIPKGKKIKIEKQENEFQEGTKEIVFHAKMMEPKAGICKIYTMDYNLKTENIHLPSIAKILIYNYYFEIIRRDLGATYSANIDGEFTNNKLMFKIRLDTDPNIYKKVNEIIENTLSTLAQNGPEENDLINAKQILTKYISDSDIEISYWRDVILFYYYKGIDQHSNYKEIIDNISIEDVRMFVKRLLDQNNSKTIIMLPEQ